MSAPRLLETMRVVEGRVPLLARHLARLAASADALGVAVDLGAVRERAEAEAAGAWGLRLTVGERGDLEIERVPLLQPLRTAWIDLEPLAEAGTPLCTHKTTARAHYAARLDRARRFGADEAILVNGRGEVTEGTRTTVWVEVDGRLWTPPLAAGGLAGVFRAEALATDPRTGERPLTPDDLRAADAVLLTNALRGWMPVRLVDPGGGSRVHPVPHPFPP